MQWANVGPADSTRHHPIAPEDCHLRTFPLIASRTIEAMSANPLNRRTGAVEMAIGARTLPPAATFTQAAFREYRPSGWQVTFILVLGERFADSG